MGHPGAGAPSCGPRVAKSASPDSRLGDGAVEQGAEAAVQAQDAMAADCLPHAVPWGRGRSATPPAGRRPARPRRPPRLTDAPVARRVRALVQLQLRLHVLGGEGDADFDAARQAACRDARGPS